MFLFLDMFGFFFKQSLTPACFGGCELFSDMKICISGFIYFDKVTSFCQDTVFYYVNVPQGFMGHLWKDNKLELQLNYLVFTHMLYVKHG